MINLPRLIVPAKGCTFKEKNILTTVRMITKTVMERKIVRAAPVSFKD